MSWKVFIIRLGEIIVIVNIAVLNLLAFQSFPRYTASATTSHISQTSPSLTPFPSSPQDSQQAMQATAEQTTPLPTIIQTVVQTVGPKELFVPLGTGNSVAADWTNVPGVIASVDSTKYPSIKQVTFEANITVPTANQTVDIRLYNMTDEHPVWNSEMEMTGTTQYLVSSPLTLDKGNKLYQVQMKTQLQYPATLDLARIHITLN